MGFSFSFYVISSSKILSTEFIADSTSVTHQYSISFSNSYKECGMYVMLHLRK